VSVAGDLDAEVAVLRPLLTALEAELGRQRSRGHGEGRKVTPGSTPPWDPQVAAVLLDAHQGIRDLEVALRRHVAGSAWTRGGGTTATRAALAAITSLARGAPEDVQRYALSEVRRWVARARVALGEAEPFQRLPVQPGHPEPRCPYCGYMTLRSRPVRGEVRCVNPDPACVDQDGNKPVARMVFGRFTLAWQLAWNDGSVFTA
jgi:hypothetical protein